MKRPLILRPGSGRHRARRVFGQLARQQFVHCPTCGVDTAATIHGDLIRCTENHTITTVRGDQ